MENKNNKFSDEELLEMYHQDMQDMAIRNPNHPIKVDGGTYIYENGELKFIED